MRIGMARGSQSTVKPRMKKLVWVLLLLSVSLMISGCAGTSANQEVQVIEEQSRIGMLRFQTEYQSM